MHFYTYINCDLGETNHNLPSFAGRVNGISFSVDHIFTHRSRRGKRIIIINRYIVTIASIFFHLSFYIKIPKKRSKKRCACKESSYNYHAHNSKNTFTILNACDEKQRREWMVLHYFYRTCKRKTKIKILSMYRCTRKWKNYIYGQKFRSKDCIKIDEKN